MKLLAFAFFAVLTGFFFAFEAIASSDINEYHSGDIRILRLSDKSGGIPAKVLVGDQELVQNILKGGLCPSEFVTFLAVAPDDAVLIDTGNGFARGGKTVSLLREAGWPEEKITKIALTHLHLDHVGGLVENGKKIFPNVKVHVDANEYAFWKKRLADDVSDFNRPAREFMDAYADDIVLFKGGEKVLPWLDSLSVPGHTPGHAVFVLENGGQKLLIGGDVIHCLEVQSKHPQITVIWDEDGALAHKSRQEFLRQAAEKGDIVLGGHFPAPGAARFTPAANDGFNYEFIQPQQPLK